jgi:hypothetical protein
MKNRIVIIALTLALGGCKPLWVGMVSPEGPPEYRLGWEDGCDSGLSAEGGWEYKMMYGFKKRPEMAANEQYKQAWNEGFSYCRFSLASSSKAAEFKDIGW